MSLAHIVSLDIPFETPRQAEIARQTLLPDPILRAEELQVTYTASEAVLNCKFAGVSDRVIRVAISNLIDNIKTIIECMDEFDGKDGIVFEEV